MNSWFLRNPQLFAEFRREIDTNYPTLNVVVIDGIVYIKGTLFIKNKSGKELGRFAIEIRIPDDYPDSLPVLKEVGRKFKKIADRHFNPKDESACLFFRDERYKYFPKGSSIRTYIDGPVKDFFLWQMDYDLNGGKSSFGERGHGTEGLIDSYKEELGVDSVQAILKFLELLVCKDVLGNRKCYCGSGSLLKSCHIEKLKDLKEKISRKDAKQSLEDLISYIRIHKVGKMIEDRKV